MKGSLNPKDPKTIEEVADIVFSFFPEEELRKYERVYNGRTLTLRDQFVVYFFAKGTPKTIVYREFIESAVREIKSRNRFNLEKPNFSVFNFLFTWYRF